jgi:hypothetical protein
MHTVPFDACPLCDAPLDATRTACTRCDWVPGYGERHKLALAPHRRDVAAAVLSIVPVAGHLLKGYVGAGFILMISIPLVLLFAGALNLFLGWAVPFLFWPAVMLDAYFRRDLRPGIADANTRP